MMAKDTIITETRIRIIRVVPVPVLEGSVGISGTLGGPMGLTGSMSWVVVLVFVGSTGWSGLSSGLTGGGFSGVNPRITPPCELIF